jgi:hypothetical protein
MQMTQPSIRMLYPKKRHYLTKSACKEVDNKTQKVRRGNGVM